MKTRKSTHLKAMKDVYLYEGVLDFKKNKEYEIIDFFEKPGFVDVTNEQGVVVTLSINDENFNLIKKEK